MEAMGLHQGQRGSKDRLIRAIMEHGVTYRKAEQIVTAVLNSITAAIRRGETVDIDGFGFWSVVPQGKKRAWRFGKVVTMGPQRLTFTFTGDLTGFVSAEASQNQRPTPEDDFTKYVQTIRRFLQEDLRTDDHLSFWVIRWNSGWYHNTFAASENPGRYSIDQVRRAIDETRPTSLPLFGPNRTVDLVIWYARWCSAIDVDRDLWTRAERFVSSQY
jgi:nucleoid DNA-binding protein